MAEIQVDKIYGPKLTWADFVMGRNDPEPFEGVLLFSFFYLILCIPSTIFQLCSNRSFLVEPVITDLILCIPSTIFQLCSNRSSLVEPVITELGLMCLAKKSSDVNISVPEKICSPFIVEVKFVFISMFISTKQCILEVNLGGWGYTGT